MSDFTASSVAHGLKEGEFEELSPDVSRKLVRLMARIAEQSYRRGFQHGVMLGSKVQIDPVELRFDRSTNLRMRTSSVVGSPASSGCSWSAVSCVCWGSTMTTNKWEDATAWVKQNDAKCQLNIVRP